MEDPPSITLSQPQKRPFDDEVTVSTPTKAPPSSASPLSTPLTVLSTVPSPSKQANSVTSDAPASSSTPSGTQPAKRRKLTEKEKEEKRLEQEAKDKAKAEKKAKKEEEQRAKDEEKCRKNEEREEKKRAKELAQQHKEEDKRKKEEEKHKKEQAQLRLNAFFVKKPAETIPTVEATETTTIPPLLAPDVPLKDANIAPVSPQKAIRKKAQNDYERVFLPFQVSSHTILAPYNRFMADPDILASAASRLDQVLVGKGSNTAPVEPAALKSKFPRRSRGWKSLSIIDLVERINGSSHNPIDLTDDMSSSGNRQDPLEQLKRIPMKYLHYPEDVRPSYYGTYTKAQSTRRSSRLGRCPFSRSLQETNYDYDSEAEWEEPQEGDEELDSEGDDDLDEDAGEDMDGFLDDENDPQVKRRLLNGDMEPVSTGLCWEDSRGVSRLNDGSGAICTELKEFRMGFLLPQPHPIDPFSAAYWAPDPATVTATMPTKENTIVGMMNPPTRMPLTQRPVNGMLNTLNSSDKHGITGLPKATKAAKRLVPQDQISAFKMAIDGSDLTKIALIEHLKKQFPKLTKDTISNTLSAVAARIGPKEVEKRWVLNP
ncbi:chromatin assembly factor 1 subunit A-domain-containing protein [Lophiotrema nucula]|uniref:Chromatin assembly factor 1 subunit A-domain-containing protein n=1 Tax=Lophiotrema nucula TaxID=690887 RepID=A0A6A5YHA2_9PLEO|nr:chromatin assembly factor 1 subunit A-domain-containing protein [Lophiotrema nucula]